MKKLSIITIAILLLCGSQAFAMKVMSGNVTKKISSKQFNVKTTTGRSYKCFTDEKNKGGEIKEGDKVQIWLGVRGCFISKKR